MHARPIFLGRCGSLIVRAVNLFCQLHAINPEIYIVNYFCGLCKLQKQRTQNMYLQQIMSANWLAYFAK